ncbi:MAG: hypothetical protein KKH52_03025 [Nanoarchaeota archaeon]|nr:hypothetical protein [Nanoarchaeota archaeon]MBU1622824.1 hypothetical protein [Nanoarchaeota archaeon]MBU1974342.1 hypothetical protein [Nanoarchaeota archaeon]
MAELLERVVVKLLCEGLPGDKTIFERDGECHKPNQVCQYCQEYGSYLPLCYKKTYTLQLELVRV